MPPQTPIMDNTNYSPDKTIVVESPVSPESPNSPDKASNSLENSDIIQAGEICEKDELTLQQAKKLKFATSLNVGLQLQAFCASHIICRDVIASAAVGLTEKLGPYRYEWSVTCLYFTYVTFPILTVFLFKRCNPRIFLGTEMFLWGLNCLLFAFPHNYAGFIMARIFLGIMLNFGLPAMMHVIYENHGRFNGQFILSCAWGVSWFLVPCFAMIAIALGLIHDGKPGWAWMIIVTGTAGCLQSSLVFLTLPEYFYSQRWIKKNGQAAYEWFKDYTEADYAGGNPVEPEESLVQGLVMALKDPLVWSCAILGLFTILGLSSTYGEFMNYALSYLKYSPAEGQLIIWPIMFTGMVWCMVQAWFSGKLKMNYYFLLSNYIFAIIGWALIVSPVSDRNLWIKYGGAWFILPNMIAAFVTLIFWMGSNIQGRNRRLMSFTMFAMIANWYGVIEYRTFISKEIPVFHRGAWINMSFMIAAVFLSTAIWGYLKWMNRRGTPGGFVNVE